MKKQALGILLALCFVTMLATVCAQAQSGVTQGRATIPFDFVVSNQTLTAGAYTIEYVTQGRDVLMLRRADGSAGVIFNTSPADALAQTGRFQLVFHRYGERYFLAQLWSPNDGTIHKLYECRRERVLVRESAKRATVQRQNVTVAMRR